MHDNVIIIITGENPRRQELHLLELNGNRKPLRIVERVAANWEKLAVSLGFNSDRINIIRRQVHFDPEEACFNMFDRWLNGEHDLKHPEWLNLIKSLEETSVAEFKELARELTNAIGHSDC